MSSYLQEKEKKKSEGEAKRALLSKVTEKEKSEGEVKRAVPSKGTG